MHPQAALIAAVEGPFKLVNMTNKKKAKPKVMVNIQTNLILKAYNIKPPSYIINLMI